MASTVNGACPASPSTMMQLIDYDETFYDQVGQYLELSRLTSLGFDYHVTAIMGPQSSGKSTLLNLLFGTKFRTMDEQRGRYQVTQGVWIGRDKQSKIVVLDLEGTDSRERGEDAISFERKSALFALAMSEVLIINLWTNDIGRFNAANLSLLRTVLELDLQLFFAGVKERELGVKEIKDGEDHTRFYKTRLLFVLRDHVETPFEQLKKILRTDVDNIWNSIDKPDTAANMKVDDFFDLDFFALPHKVLMKDEFVEAGERLKSKFYSDELFRPEYSRMVTADGFATYAESVWSTIRDNKELDIPTQKEMVATVRCEQISQEVFTGFVPVLEEISQALAPRDGIATNIVPTLFQSLLAAMSKTLADYDARVLRYSRSIATAKRRDLCTNMINHSQSLISAQLTLVSTITMGVIERSMKQACANESPWDNFERKAEGWMKEAQKSFDEQCGSDLIISQGDDDGQSNALYFSETLSLARAKLKRDVDDLVAKTIQDVLRMGKSICRKHFREKIEVLTDKAIDKAPANHIWQQIANANELAWNETRKELANVIGADGLNIKDGDRCARIMMEMREECYGEALGCVKGLIGRENAFLLRVMKRFNDVFRFDERGVPRTFGPNEDIETLFVLSKEKALGMVDAWGVVQGGLGLFEKRDAVILFSQSDRSIMKEDVSRQAAAVFMEAKRSQEASRVTSRIPLWLIILLMVVGFDELVMVLRNPIFLLLGLIVLPLLYVGFSPQAKAYVVPMVSNAARPALMKVRQALDEYLPASPHKEASVGASGSGTTGENLGSSFSSSTYSSNVAESEIRNEK